MAGFSLLRASDEYCRKEPVCYDLTFYIEYRYGELSIFLPFILSQYTPAWVDLLILYIDTEQICYCHYVLFEIITEFYFRTYFE